MTTFRLRATALVALSALTAACLYAQTPLTRVDRSDPRVRNLLHLPLAFEKQGTNEGDRFVARGQEYVIGLQGSKATIASAPAPGTKAETVSLGFSGGRSARAVAGPELPGKVNYIHGNDPRKWELGRATYERVTYPGVYPGIDVVYYGNQEQLEFDLVLKPGADPRSIRLKVDGASKLALDASGALRLGDGNLRIELPKIYQEVNGTKKSVAGHYALRGRNEVGFKVDAYDRSRPLVIDPTIVYSALLGGSSNSIAYGIALDSSGDVYLAGSTFAQDFPVVNALQNGLINSDDGFIAEINPTGTALLYSTYIGGSSSDTLQSIQVDSNGNAWVAGFSDSPDFPLMNATQAAFGGGVDAVVVELNSTGGLQFSTYLGGPSLDEATGIAIDSKNAAYVTGYSAGSFPTTSGVLQSTNQGSSDVFVAKFNSSDAEVYATLLGGAGNDTASGIAVDANFSAYVTGSTTSTTPFDGATGGAQPTNGGGTDAFIAKLNPGATALTYFTFLGGSKNDRANAIAVDSSMDAFVAGLTASMNLTTTGTLQIPYGGGFDGFVAELNPGGTSFTWLTYVGGNRTDALFGLALDGLGNVYVGGYTNSTVLPVASAIQPSLPGGGVSLFQTTNAGTSWSAFDTNIPGTVNDISADPVTAGTIVAFTEQGIFRTTNSGGSWTQELALNDTSTGTLGAFLARSPVNTDTIYASDANTIFVSTDGGETWSLGGSLPFSAQGIVADPLTASTAYAFASGSGVYITKNSGTSWALSGPPSQQPSLAVQTLTTGSDGSLYAGFSNLGIYKSTNQGSSWTAINTGLPSGITPALHSIAVLPGSASVILFAAGGAGLYGTTNGGTGWGQITSFPGQGAAQVAISPDMSPMVYVVTNSGVLYQTPDEGTTWNLVQSGLTTGNISEIAFDPTTSGHVFAVSATPYAAFIAKLNPSASSPAWLTYLGGASNTLAYGLAANGMGDVFVAGSAFAGNGFPVTSPISGALTGALTDSAYAFAVEISDATATCTYSLPGTVSSASNGLAGSGYIQVVAPAGCAWTASSDSSWAILTSTSGTGTGTVFVYAMDNTTGASRTANITVAGQTFSFTQAAASCTFTFNPSSFNISSAGGSFSSNLTTGAGCPWSVPTGNGPAITITSAPSGTGNATVSFTVAPNDGLNTRYLSIGSNLNITQAGTCTFSLSPTFSTFSAASATGSVTLTASALGCTWSASSNLSGLSITSATSGNGSATINYSLAANTGDPRASSLTIAGITFPVSQAGAGSVYVISTIAGGEQPAPTVTATAATLPFPQSVAVDAAGNTYIASQSSEVFKLAPSGVLTRFAGTGFNGFSGYSGPAVSVELGSPTGLAVDNAGNVYIADGGDSLIRMVAPNGTSTTIAGTGTFGFGGDGGPATSAAFEDPTGVALDSNGNIYIADSGNNRVREISGGMITTIAGNGTRGYSGDGAAATAAELSNPTGIAVDSNGNIYIADTGNNRVRKVTGGTITTVAGNGNCCFAGDGGLATSAQLNAPRGVAVDSANNLYIADTNDSRVRIVAENGIITTVAGNGNYAFGGDGGPATSAELRSPFAIAIDASDNLWIADFNNQRVRAVTGGIISTVAGGGGIGEPGPAPLAGLGGPSSVVKDKSGNVYFSDQFTNRIRMIAPNGAISTVAGTGAQGYSGDGAAATSAMLNEPEGLAIDKNGNLYFIDANNYRVREINMTSGNISTVAGNGTCCFSGDGGPATSAQINYGQGLAFDPSGNLYIADTNNQRIREVSGGNITTVAGNGQGGYNGDGIAATSAKLSGPDGVAFDSNGNLYIADSGNNRIREVSSGTITTFAGNGSCCFSGDGGPAASGQFNTPRAIAFDGTGNLFIADTNDNRIREVTTGGTLVTVAGNGTFGNQAGVAPAINSQFRGPLGLTVDSAGNIFVADTSNDEIRQLTPAGTAPVLTIASSHTGNFNAGGTGSYTVNVGNGILAGTTSGTVTVTEALPAGLTLNSMSGAGWSCTTNSCTRSDALTGGPYPITVSVNVSATAPLQVTNQVTVAGGGSPMTGASDFTVITPNTPAAPVLISPANGATNVSVLPTLTWSASPEAVSYDVYFGTSSTPPLLGNTTGLSFVPATMSALLNTNTPYFWQVVAKNGAGSAPSAVFSFTTYPSNFCTYSLTPGGASLAANGGMGSVSVTAPAGCLWTAVSSQAWLAITSDSNGSGNGTVNFLAAPNAGAPRNATLTIGGQIFTVTETADYLITSLIAPFQPTVGGLATLKVIPPPSGIAVDSAGNAYIAAQNLNSVYKLGPMGNLTLFAGTGVCAFSGDGAAAVSAALCDPNSVAVDSAGNVYIADSGNNRIREVTTNGTINTIAGTGQCCYAGDNGPATSAFLNFPEGVAVDSLGNVYIADTNNQRVRKITGTTITTVAGNGTSGFSGDGAAATSAQLNQPLGLAVDANFNIYIADRNNDRVRKVLASNSTIITYAGNNICCNVNDGSLATNAWLNGPQGLALDADGNLGIADSGNSRIRGVATNGVITTLAGNGINGYNGDGGAAKSAQLSYPEGVAVDASGNIWIADSNNQRVREVVAGTINTVAGESDNGAGIPPFQNLSQPASVAEDKSGNVYITDSANSLIRMINPAGVMSVVAGTGFQGYGGDGGPAASAVINHPQSLALDSSGNLYFADSGNNRIRMISGGNITTVAGNGTCCYSGDGGPATSAQINYVWGIALDKSNNLYIADSGNNRIRKVSGGTITTVAGNGTFGYNGDNIAATSAELANPQGVAVDSSLNIYIADSNNQRIRKVSGGTITTFAGDGNCCFAGDGGPAASAQFNNPRDVKIDSNNNLYIADTNDERIREVTALGTILTLAGNGNYGFTGDDGPALSAGFRTPQSIGLDPSGSGNIYVADTFNNAVRLLAPAGTVPILSIASTHTAGSFSDGGTGSYILTVSNANLAATTSGTVTVTDIGAPFLTVNTMSGSGWTCAANSCTTTNPLVGGASYPAITVPVSISGIAPIQTTNQVLVTGGGAAAAGAEDVTLIIPNTPGTPVLVSPANAATNASVVPTLTWNYAVNATSYDVYFGTSPTPPFLANTTGLSYTPATIAAPLSLNTTYYWTVVARNVTGTTAAAGTFSFTTYASGFCTYMLNPTSASFGSTVSGGAVSVTAPAGCVWTATSNQPWLAVYEGLSGSGNGSVSYSVAANTGGSRSATLTIGGQSFTVSQSGSYLISSIIGALQPATAAAGNSVVIPGPTGVVVDAAGNTYISASTRNAVFRLDASGSLTRFAGTGVCGSAGDSGPALSAQLCNPGGLAVDGSGNVYIADSGNGRIRMVTPNGTITTVAGGANCCSLGDGGPATSAYLNGPAGVTLDAAGNLYIADTYNNRVRKVSGGTITTVAGNGTFGFSGDTMAATSAELANPSGVVVDALSNIYIADRNNNRVRLVAGGTITTFAGGDVCCNLGDGGAATTAWLSNPIGLALDASGNVYIADYFNSRVREVFTSGPSQGKITTVAGTYFGNSGDGGAATSAQLGNPQAIAFDSLGDLIIADYANENVREAYMDPVETALGTISTIAGGITSVGDSGPVPFATLRGAGSVAVDASGNIYIADAQNNRVRMVTPAGAISTVAGTGVAGYSGDGMAATSAMLSRPTAVALDKSQHLYIADSNNARVRMVSGGMITTVAGNGSFGFSGDGMAATSAQLANPSAIAVDSSGDIFIADSGNNRIREVSGGNINTVAGNGNAGYNGDGISAITAQLNNPSGVAVDPAGDTVYIADPGNNRIRVVTVGGNIGTFAGNGNCCFSGDDGPAASAQLNYPRGVALDQFGNVYIADSNDQRIREVMSGTILTLAGNGGFGETGDGGPALNATLGNPQTMAIDNFGNIYVADVVNNAIRLLTPAGTNPVLTVTSTHTGSFTPGATGSYTITVTNAASAGATSGTVTVTDLLPSGLTLNTMSGSGWTCTANACTTTNPLAAGVSYPAITVSVNVSATAPIQVTNEVTLSGGGSVGAGAEDLTAIAYPAAAITVMTPNTAIVNSQSTAIAVTGTGITSGSTLAWTFNSTTTYLPATVEATQALATIPAALLTATGTAQVGIANASGVVSNLLPFTITGATPQTITFNPIANISAGAMPITVSPTSTSGLTVILSSKTPSVCTVSGFMITITAAGGGCSVTAAQPGNATYAAAPPVTQDFTVLFNDISPTASYAAAVDLFAQYGITAGCGNDDFCANSPVTRAEMAVFIITSIFRGASFNYSPTPHFADVPASGPGSFGFKFVQAMYELGITAGCAPAAPPATLPTFCPNGSVTREEMAVFIITARLGAGASFTYSSTPDFADVPDSGGTKPYFKFVQRMKQDGITAGCAKAVPPATLPTYCPTEAVTRAQMAVFMMVGLFNQFLPAGTPVITGISPSTLAAGTSGTFTITGVNTTFTQGTTQLGAINGITAGTITVNSPTSLTVQLTAAADANLQPDSIVAITGSEVAVLPSGLTVTELVP